MLMPHHAIHVAVCCCCVGTVRADVAADGDDVAHGRALEQSRHLLAVVLALHTIQKP